MNYSFGQNQVQAEEIALKEALNLLEEKFDIRFSYLDRDIQEIKLQVPDPSLSLAETLDHLRITTGLVFERLNDRYIAIRASEKRSICGILIDKRSNIPLGSASILIDDRPATASDTTGKFQVPEVSTDSNILISYIGYRALSFPVSYFSGKDCIIIYMDPLTEELREVLVINYLTSGISKLKDGTVSIDSERFGTLPGLLEPNILQTLESLPGVESVNETISNINIRGGTSDQNLVLFDGIKMYLTGHFFGLISAFNSNLTHKASLTKNGTTAALNDGVSGTIDIHSKDKIIGEFTGGGGISLINADAYFSVPITRDLELHFSGRRSLNDFFNSPTFNSYSDRTFQDSEISLSGENNENNSGDIDFNYYDLSFKLLYDPEEKHSFRLSSLYINNDLDFTQTDPGTLSESRRSSLAQKNLALGGTWTAYWNDNLSTEVLGYLTKYRLGATNLVFEPDQKLLQQNEVLETGVKISATKKINNHLYWTNGYNFYETGVLNAENLNDPFFSSRIKNVIRSNSIFSELVYNRNRLFLKTGLRYNYLDKFEKHIFEPRLSFDYKLNETLNFKILGEFKSQVISQSIDLQEDFLGVENRRWILANGENFPVIQSKQLSAGFDVRSNGWYIDLEAYLKKVEGISTSNQGFQDQNEFRRLPGNYIAEGIELLINKKLGNFHTFIGYSLSSSDYRFNQLDPEEFPNNFDIPHSVSMATSYTYKRFKFSVGGKWRSGRPFTRPVNGNETRREANDIVVNYNDPNSSRLPSFFRLDVSSSYSLDLTKDMKAAISLGLLNILDRNNIINSYYRVAEENSSQVIRFDNSSLRFTPNFLFRIEF